MIALPPTWAWVSAPPTYPGVLGESPANLPQGSGGGAIASSIYLGMLDVCPAQLPNYLRVLGNAPPNFPVLPVLAQYPDHLPRTRSAAALPIYLRVLGECLFPIYLGMFSKRPTNSSHLFPAAGNNIEDAGGEAGQLREGGQGEG
jgi:hypothetical protein